MSYVVLGRASKSFNNPENILKRQVAAAEYIKSLNDGIEIINIDESILRSTDHRRRGWAFASKRVLVSYALRLN